MYRQTKRKGKRNCAMEAEDAPETVLRRANNLRVYGFGRYNLALRNCMDFAFYCKTGRPYYDAVAYTLCMCMWMHMLVPNNHLTPSSPLFSSRILDFGTTVAPSFLFGK